MASPSPWCLPMARVGVDVHLHHARFDGVADVLQTGAAAAVEDEGAGLVAVAAQLLLLVVAMVRLSWCSGGP